MAGYHFRVLVALVSTLAAMPALSAEKILFGPTPAWVRPIALPPTQKPDDAAVRIQLSDQQYAFAPDQQSAYIHTVTTIQTAQGLAAANIAIAWRPEINSVTVHAILLRRGAEVIDVLAAGQTFTILRREQNLENAMLDGVLTATLQPEGVRVGDTLDIALTITSSDPVFKGHVEQLAASWNGVPVARAHLRAEWPASLPLRLRQTAALPAIKPVTANAVTSVELSLDGLQPVPTPSQAPPRYSIGRLIEFTDFASWADLSALMAPLYESAARLPAQGPLLAEVARIKALSPDPRRRAEAALALVQDRVRYVALAMGSGGYVPADAETTWSRRFGDCKGKTALLIALLTALDIEAQPVLVSSFGDGLDARLPLAGMFDHVLVRATIGGKTVWLDGTRTGDTSLDRLQVLHNVWGLPVQRKAAALVRMVPPPLEQPQLATTIRMDASAELYVPAPTHIETVLRGDSAIGVKASLDNLTGDTRDRALRDYWRGRFDFIDIKSTSATFDPATGEQRLVMDGDARMDWSEDHYQTDGTRVGYRADFTRDKGLGSDAPFAVAYPVFTSTQQTILLPRGFENMNAGTAADVDQIVAGIHYKRSVTLRGNVFTVDRTERTLVPEFPAAEAPAAQAALRALDVRYANLRKPANYVPTRQDIVVLRAKKPTTAEEHLKRADLSFLAGLDAEVMPDLDQAVALAPDNAIHIARRAIERIKLNNLDGARSDVAKALALGPSLINVQLAKGMLAMANRDFATAVAALTEALVKSPWDTRALTMRSASHLRLGDREKAKADLDAAVAIQPDSVSPYIARGTFFLDVQSYDEAFANFDKAVALAPSNGNALVHRGMAHAWKNRLDSARKDLDAAEALNPGMATLLIMQRARGVVAQKSSKFAEAIAAYTAALKIDPRDSWSLKKRFETHIAAGNADAAIADTRAMDKLEPGGPEAPMLRVSIYRGLGRSADAVAEAEAIVASEPKISHHYVFAGNIFSVYGKVAEAEAAYERAFALGPRAFVHINRAQWLPGLAPATRIAELDTALRLEPDLIEALPLKAKFQSEQGDHAAAAESYSVALRTKPDTVEWLAQRGIAYVRTGNVQLAEADFAAARKAASSPLAFNSICWTKATAGIALEAALDDCDAALKDNPDAPGFLDSRGLVLFRLGRFDDAIADYDKALAKAPTQSSSLFGRALAWAAKGNKARATADSAAAVKANPNVMKEYKGYGLTL